MCNALAAITGRMSLFPTEATRCIGLVGFLGCFFACIIVLPMEFFRVFRSGFAPPSAIMLVLWLTSGAGARRGRFVKFGLEEPWVQFKTPVDVAV